MHSQEKHLRQIKVVHGKILPKKRRKIVAKTKTIADSLRNT